MITGRPDGPHFSLPILIFFLFAFFSRPEEQKAMRVFFFKCCDHPNKEWKSPEQHRGKAEDTENDQKWVRNRAGQQIGETLPESPRIQSSWYLASDSADLDPSQPLSRHGSYMPGHLSSVSFSYSSL